MSRIALVLILLATACGGGDSLEGGSPGSNSPASTSRTTALAPETAPSTAANSTTEAGPDLNVEIAPDFSLQLGNGETFTLSEENRPVYLLFWAEW